MVRSRNHGGKHDISHPGSFGPGANAILSSCLRRHHFGFAASTWLLVSRINLLWKVGYPFKARVTFGITPLRFFNDWITFGITSFRLDRCLFCCRRNRARCRTTTSTSGASPFLLDINVLDHARAFTMLFVLLLQGCINLCRSFLFCPTDAVALVHTLGCAWIVALH